MTQLSLFEYFAQDPYEEKEPEFIPSREDLVLEFHEAFNLPTGDRGDLTIELIDLRVKLLREELEEVETALYAFYNEPCVEREIDVLKEMCDLNYVLSGTAVVFGLDLEEAFYRVHESNMSKLGDDGKPIYRDDGKVLKGARYMPPFLEDLI